MISVAQQQEVCPVRQSRPLGVTSALALVVQMIPPYLKNMFFFTRTLKKISHSFAMQQNCQLQTCFGRRVERMWLSVSSPFPNPNHLFPEEPINHSPLWCFYWFATKPFRSRWLTFAILHVTGELESRSTLAGDATLLCFPADVGTAVVLVHAGGALLCAFWLHCDVKNAGQEKNKVYLYSTKKIKQFLKQQTKCKSLDYIKNNVIYRVCRIYRC